MFRAALLFLLLATPALAQRGKPWWSDSTKWPPGTFRRVTTRRPAHTVAVGDTLALAPPAFPAGLPDSIARDVRWGADDPRVLVVEPGRAVARAAGSTTVIIWTRVGPTLVPVRVVAAQRGRLHTADGSAPPPARARSRRPSGLRKTNRGL
ncbi:hypothetical protein, partial [Roseisolibacter sp. H3M3-2]|uniref:hypothetical protein n=1 Tax=Roseisolibacter sp. H3M3-2 TaxID=3031323 RepID=UPI0023DBB731